MMPARKLTVVIDFKRRDAFDARQSCAEEKLVAFCARTIPILSTRCMYSVHCEISFLNYVPLAYNLGLVGCNKVRVMVAYP